jgi:hypothetical protein
MRIQYFHQKPRTVPFAMKHIIEKELDGLENLGVIEKVTYSNWGTPIVPVIKSDKILRLCAALCRLESHNEQAADNYPIPRIDNIFSKLTGGKYFCTLISPGVFTSDDRQGELNDPVYFYTQWCLQADNGYCLV